MTISISEQSVTALSDYARIPIAFEIREVLTVVADVGGLRLVRSACAESMVKDYDAIPGNHPSLWNERFDLSNWGLLAAWQDGVRIGGAAIAWDTPGCAMLEGRRDLAVLWDLRVAPTARRQGVGTALWQAVEAWMSERGMRMLKVETQNINVPACDFYARQGCVLGAIDRFAYPGLPDEAQLMWYKPLH